jgi:hypothetical protein
MGNYVILEYSLFIKEIRKGININPMEYDKAVEILVFQQGLMAHISCPSYKGG